MMNWQKMPEIQLQDSLLDKKAPMCVSFNKNWLWLKNIEIATF